MRIHGWHYDSRPITLNDQPVGCGRSIRMEATGGIKMVLDAARNQINRFPVEPNHERFLVSEQRHDELYGKRTTIILTYLDRRVTE